MFSLIIYFVIKFAPYSNQISKTMQKNTYALLFLALSFFFTFCQPKKSDETQSADGFYGAKITEEGAMPAADLKKFMVGKDSAKVKILGTIDECCKKKGCWMDVVLAEDEYMKVKFKDYDFFVPKDADGMTAIFEGNVSWQALTKDEIKHYAEDEGKTPEEAEKIAQDTTNAQKKLVFLADGVIIKNYPAGKKIKTDEAK